MTDSSLATPTLALQREAHTEARSGATSSRAPERRGVRAYYAPIDTRGLLRRPSAAPYAAWCAARPTPTCSLLRRSLARRGVVFGAV